MFPALRGHVGPTGIPGKRRGVESYIKHGNNNNTRESITARFYWNLCICCCNPTQNHIITIKNIHIKRLHVLATQVYFRLILVQKSKTNVLWS